MKLETFFEKFEQFADAPNAVAKMRELIRHLAVTGKLIAQEPRDESGELLLQRINAERLAAVKARQISPMKTLPEIRRDELLFELPSGWAAARLIELVMEIQTGPFGSSLHKSDYQLGGTPVINPASLRDGNIVPIEEMAIGHATLKRLEVFKLSAGDIVMARRGEMGRCAIVTKSEEGWLCGTGSLILRMPCALYAPYFAMLIGAPMARTYLSGAAVGTTMQNLNQSILAKMPVGVPPLSEQKRIVAKVDELMALCDRLEAQQQERDTRHAALARASLARFAEAPAPANLDFLFHQSYTIAPADLRKSILTLAVQGKLVPQDPIDSYDGHNMHDETNSDAPHDIPETWAWTCLGELAKFINGDRSKNYPSKSFRVETGVPFINAGHLVNGDVALDGMDYITEAHFDLLGGGKVESGDVLYCLRGSLGKSAVVTSIDRGAIASSLLIIRPSNRIIERFLYAYLTSPLGALMISKYDNGSAQPNLSAANVKKYLVPLPPLAEQHRIVAKVEQLMALVDQLETQLSEARAKSTALLEAVIHELLNPSAEIIDLASYRAAIGCYAISKMSDKRYFGRTAAMKTLYLAEAHVGMRLGFQPEREAAGPLDPWLYRFEDEGKQKAWFKAVENASNGKMKVEYQPGEMLVAQAAHAESLLTPEQRKEFDRLLDLLSDKKTEEVEIIATLFAVWNDFLIDGHVPSDDEIVTEVRENWHERKERFTPALLRRWLGWLRQHSLVPQGRLPHTVHQSNLSFN
jgi:type I restriction enzyme S subunit